MSDLQELYQEVILDHNRSPRNYGALSNPDREAKGVNPLCGDKLTLFLNLKDNVIDEVQFEGCGCAISMASASLMTESLKGKTLDEAEGLFEKFHLAVTEADTDISSMGKLGALVGVRQFPMRVKCATLAWHTLRSALANESANVSTE